MYETFAGPYHVWYHLIYGWVVLKNGKDVDVEEALLALRLFVN